MTIPTYHPIRDYPIRVYFCEEAEEPHRFRAVFGSGRDFPIYFDAPDFHSAHARAETFREETILKHEAAFLARMQNVAKARAAKKRKSQP